MVDRLLSKAEVLQITGLSYPTIWAMMRRGEFPRSVEITLNRIAWHESDIISWKEVLPQRRLKGDPPESEE